MIALLIIIFSISGIILNHRELLSSVDVNRNILPEAFQYNNWNNAAVRATVKLNENSFLTYGNIGIWHTDSTFSKFTDFNVGFPDGIDNRKIFKILQTNKELLAGTLFGLYEFNHEKKQWLKIPLPLHEENVVDILQKGDSTFVLTRSHLLLTTNLKTFNTINLPQSENYDNKVGLFKTLWVIHSGEIYGEVGKLLVDLMALVFIFLSVGGVILFFSKRQIKKAKTNKPKQESIRKTHKWNLKWHNKIGWITAIFLIFTTLTGMFLRPPLLIAIAYNRVAKIPFTELDTPNPWFDVLRRVMYIPEKELFIISTSEGFYSFDKDFKNKAKMFEIQPPASVMGVTVFEQLNAENVMVGSFEGLFSWNYKTGKVFDLIKKQPYVRPIKKGPPVGDYKVSGYSSDFKGQQIAFEYQHGAINLDGGSEFTPMPENIIENAPMSLWNLALEVHTGRIYGAFLGIFYILVVPLSGILILLTLIGGIVVWYKFHFRKKK
jgi:hypothetical protein